MPELYELIESAKINPEQAGEDKDYISLVNSSGEFLGAVKRDIGEIVVEALNRYSAVIEFCPTIDVNPGDYIILLARKTQNTVLNIATGISVSTPDPLTLSSTPFKVQSRTGHIVIIDTSLIQERPGSFGTVNLKLWEWMKVERFFAEEYWSLFQNTPNTLDKFKLTLKQVLQRELKQGDDDNNENDPVLA